MNGAWGLEETTSVSKFDLERGEKFDFDVILTTNEFLVAINGKHNCAFVYRLPLTKVKAIRVEGRVDIHKVDYKKVDLYPTPCLRNAALTVPVGEEQRKIPEEKMVIIILSLSRNDAIFISFYFIGKVRSFLVIFLIGWKVVNLFSIVEFFLLASSNGRTGES